ncbi:hypothetical protein ACFQY5_15670 [Paeniroseomonas aquatica]|uniref:hypothetical protein n=1 Tax=Paeniroseomonas aquatica TaxID=373043 RepID=UPI00360BAAD8
MLPGFTATRPSGSRTIRARCEWAQSTSPAPGVGPMRAAASAAVAGRSSCGAATTSRA